MPDFVLRHARGAAIVVALALVFTFLGVYGTNDMPFLHGFLMWLFTISVGAISSLWISPMVFEREPSASWPVVIQLVVAAVVIALPVTIAILLAEASDGRVMPAQYWPMQFFYVYVISQVITIGGYLLQTYSEGREAQAALESAGGVPAAPDTTAALLDRLPPKYRGADLYAVSSEDHYLRIHTSLGEEMILMRLADAIDLLAQSDGLQVHRSWWVARDGIEDVERANGKPVLKLKSGGEAPVSRTYQKAAREAGFV
ncbi:MAG: LytTR family DNA-binding domain-containing protein [Pseudomonadota bacterium]